MQTLILALAAVASVKTNLRSDITICPSQDSVNSVMVCAPMNTYDSKLNLCTKTFYAGTAKETVSSCYLEQCYGTKTPPAGVAKCTVSDMGENQDIVDQINGVATSKKPVEAASLRGTATTLGVSPLAPTTVTSSFAARQLSNLPPRWGWPDIDNSAFLNFPESLIGRLGQIPNVYLDNSFEMRFACPNGGAAKKCDLFAFIYRCPPCTFADGRDDTSPSPATFAAKLLADGWEPYSCDVKFQLDQTVPTHEHGVIVYHRQMDQHSRRNINGWYTIQSEGLLELSWYATSEATAHCSDYDKDDCLTILPKECQWDEEAQTCNRVLCPMEVRPELPPKAHGPGTGKHRPRGPWGEKCKVCVDDERDMYMPKLK